MGKLNRREAARLAAGAGLAAASSGAVVGLGGNVVARSEDLDDADPVLNGIEVKALSNGHATVVLHGKDLSRENLKVQFVRIFVNDRRPKEEGPKEVQVASKQRAQVDFHDGHLNVKLLESIRFRWERTEVARCEQPGAARGTGVLTVTIEADDPGK